jgi:hypothetical protein
MMSPTSYINKISAHSLYSKRGEKEEKDLEWEGSSSPDSSNSKNSIIIHIAVKPFEYITRNLILEFNV